ncbi:MAG: GntR family transcriptional regulator [Paracoccaceae bacterium]|nr:GntR family transcriptional regulator [Paracoccaceae bacterium]
MATTPSPKTAAQHGPERTDARPVVTGAYLYDAVRDLLARKIHSGELPSGAVLKEGTVSTHVGVSRAPVRRALAMLANDGLIRGADGQGYIVGQGKPIRMSNRRLHDILVAEPEDIDRSATWERIFTTVLDEVLSVMPFGTYRIQEAELGRYHDVSRTVVREVLWRLLDRRLIEKDRKSHWIIGQMTARSVRDSLEMRRLLEPQALGNVAAQLDRNWLRQLEERIAIALAQFPDCNPSKINMIERDMFGAMYDGLRNARMLGSIRRNQFALIIPTLFRQNFPNRDDRPDLVTYGQIVQQLQSGTAEAAQVLLRMHLERAERLTLARLRVLSLLPPPVSIPYLFSTH